MGKKQILNINKKQCPQCGSTNISFQFVQQEDPKSVSNGCLVGSIAYIFLLFVPIIGWIILIALLTERKKMDNVTYALCNNCGNSWLYQNKDEEIRKKKQKKRLIIGSIIIAAFFIFSFIYEVSSCITYHKL